MITVHYCHHTGGYYLSCEFVIADKYILRDCIQNLSVCLRNSSHFPSALIRCLYETANKCIFHAAVILLCHTHTHTHTHQNTVMKVAGFWSATAQCFYIANAATIFPKSRFLFDCNLIKFEGNIAVSTSGRMGSIKQHRPTLCYCSFCTLHIEPKWSIPIQRTFSMPCSHYVIFCIEKYAVRVRFDFFPPLISNHSTR